MLSTALAITACTDASDGEEAEPTVAEPAVTVDGPLARCLDIEPSEPESPTRMSIERIAEPGEEITVRWDFDDPDELNRSDLVVDCWTEDGWDAAWVSVEVFGDFPKAVIVEPGQDAAVNDAGIRIRTGVVVVPDSAPDGYYRARTFKDSAVFQVRASTP